MGSLKSHIKKLDETLKKWFRPDNRILKNAIDRTVSEGFFSFEDIKHQIRHLRNSVNEETLIFWAENSKLNYNSLQDKRILCLHAGNLPLVGFQDMLAVLMTGGQYFGKISRKDPYLLPTFLELIQEIDSFNNIDWSTDLNHFKNLNADAVLFAGSKSSASEVENKLNRMDAISKNTPLLIRTAHFSIAIIRDNSKKTMEDLTEAVFRYGGNGCRSVAIVVAPFHLNSQKCEFTDYIELFWMNNPQHNQPDSSLFYRYAYNKAVDIEQAWLDHFLVEEHESNPNDSFILKWIKGDFEDAERVIEKYNNGLQSVYCSSQDVEIIGNRFVEPLSQAQIPPIWWKPDQIDTIEWLQKNVKHDLS